MTQSGMATRLCALALGLALLTACGDDPGPDADAPVSTSSNQTATGTTRTPTDLPTNEPAGEPTDQPKVHHTRIVRADSEFGTILYDGTGQAIYMFDAEETARPACYDACADAWPPVLAAARKPVAGAGVQDSLLGTTARTDGGIQVTYKDHPLYFYAHEGKHEVECHNVFLNGGTWYALQPNGNPAPAA